MESETPKGTSPSRIVYIDLLRITAVFGVILLHIAASRWTAVSVTSENWQIMNVYNGLVRWTVPVFVMISGVFHLQPYKKNITEENTTFKQEMNIMGRKTGKLLTGLVFWSVIYYYLGKFLERNFAFHTYDIIHIPLAILLGPAWVHLWFLYMLIGLYLLTPIFRCFIAHCTQEHITYFLMLFFIIGYCFPLINWVLKYVPLSKIHVQSRTLYLPVNELTGYLGYYIAGYYFSHFKISKPMKITLYIGAVISLFFTIFGNSWESEYTGKAQEALFGNLLPNTMFVSYGVFLFFQDFFGKRQFSKKAEVLISKLSKHTFGIYLVHILIIWIFEIIGINIFTAAPVLVSIPLISVMVMILSFIVTVILSKIPVLNRYIV